MIQIIATLHNLHKQPEKPSLINMPIYLKFSFNQNTYQASLSFFLGYDTAGMDCFSLLRCILKNLFPCLNCDSNQRIASLALPLVLFNSSNAETTTQK